MITKHKKFKNKILSIMLDNNQDNNWISLQYIESDLFVHRSDVIPRICAELVQDRVLEYGIVKHVEFDDYRAMYMRYRSMFKITDEYIKTSECDELKSKLGYQFI